MSLVQDNKAYDYILTESGPISRDQITLRGSGKIQAGTPLGELTAEPGVYMAVDPAAATGIEVTKVILCKTIKLSDDATVVDKNAVVTARLSEVNDKRIEWAAFDTAQKAVAISELSASFIIVR